MADWYVSSTAYAVVPQWAASTAYTVGQFIRPVTPNNSGNALHVFRCTTAGTTATTEPGWSTGNNQTTSSGGATFTNVAGQSTYGWSAAAGSLYSIGTDVSNRPVAGDRVFISSDSAESLTAGGNTWGFGGNTYGLVQIISVNRAGSVPPVAGDILSGASVTCSNGIYINPNCSLFIQGISFYNSSGTNTLFSNSGSATKNIYFKNCLLALTNSGANPYFSTSQRLKVILDNTPVSFANSGSGFGIGNGPILDLLWINTPSAVQGTAPSNLFNGGGSSGSGPLVVCRGVDLSAVTTNLVANTSNWFCKLLLDSCRVSSSVTYLSLTGSPIQEVELVNCYNGTSIINERHICAGDVTTDRTTYLTGGAQDDIGNYSLKLASNANTDFAAYPLDCFAFDVENTLIGSSHTATVEIISSSTLNNNDIRLLLEYPSTSTPIQTWNPADTFGAVTLSGGNLTATTPSSAAAVRATGGYTGKIYWEQTVTTWGSATSVGCARADSNLSLITTNIAGQCVIFDTGILFVNAVNNGALLGTQVSGNTIGMAVDTTANLMWFRVCPSGNWNGSGTANPATGTGGITLAQGTAGTQLVGVPLFPMLGVQSTASACTLNVGNSAFSGTVPSGFASASSTHSGSPIASMADSLPSVLTLAAALPSSSATWNSPPSTPVTQHLQVTFTPQRAGRIRGLVRLGKPSTTCWVDPRITIT